MKTIYILAIAATATLSVSSAMAERAGGRGGDRPSFEQLDANSDGQVTLAELQAQGQKRFAEMDANGDGSLDVDELLAKHEGRNENRAKRRINRMISRMDADENGTLEFAELEKRFDGARMMKHLDANEDGAISAEEFAEAKGRHGGRRGGNNGNDDS